MVSLDELGLEVKIFVNSSPATEYLDGEPGAIGDEYDEAIPKTYKYIESFDDAPFAVQVGAKRGAVNRWLSNGIRHALRFYVDVDNNQGVARGSVTRDGHSDLVIGAREDSDTQHVTRRFLFAPVSTVDDAGKHQVTEDIERAKRLGVISVRAYRSTYRSTYINIDAKAGHSKNRPALEQKDGISIAEKALKGRAVSHGSVFSEPIYKSKSGRSRYYHLIDPAPIAIFFFKYRSKEALQQELIIPRPRGVSLGSDVEILPEDKVRQLAHANSLQKRGNKKRPASVKIEPDEVPRSERPLKILKTEGGRNITIDLTEDD